MGEPLSIPELHLLGNQVLECIEDDMSRGWLVEEQDIEMLDNIAVTLEKRERKGKGKLECASV